MFRVFRGPSPRNGARSLLAIDVGNSRLKFALLRIDPASDSPGRLPDVSASVTIQLAESIPWEEIGQWQRTSPVGGLPGVIAGANPAGIDRVLQEWPGDWHRPRRIGEPSRFPLDIDVAEPHRVGIDRLLNAVAANRIRPAGQPAVIMDAGTATTVDLVSATGAFQGGSILPGLELSARSLHQYTALLPEIPIEELASCPPQPLGRDTRQALRSGLFWGQVGAVRELTRRLSGEPRLLLLTGGGAPLLQPYLPANRHEPHLALQGLALVAEAGS